MEMLSNIFLGFSVALQPTNLFFCFVGVVLGTLVGVLPGLGPIAAISLLLPGTFKMPAVTGIIMMAGVFYGAMYGGSTTSILVNIPGEAASIVTCIDGYQMARRGRAGAALGIAAIGSFIAGTFSIILLMFLTPVLGNYAVKLGPSEYFTLMILGMTILTYLARGSVLKAWIMAVAGLFMGTIGTDPVTGHLRFTYGSNTLAGGVGLIPVAMGMFGVAEVLSNLEITLKHEVFQTKIKNIWPTWNDWVQSRWSIVRGSILGFFVGVLPGPSATIASFASYALERRISDHPEKFGTGAIEGVAGPESANNAATGAAFIPLLALGIPANIIMGLFLGALLIHGIKPGPLFISEYPELFWGVVTSMYVGNGMLLILNLPLIGLWVKVVKMPYHLLFPLILLLCLLGAYSLNNNPTDILIMVIFGLFGYLVRKFKYEAAPFLLALVLGPMMESNLRQALLISHGTFVIFVTRPFSLFLLIVSFIILLTSLFPALAKRKKLMTDDA
jgi:putative tricarboxylic transport membrane protein